LRLSTRGALGNGLRVVAGAVLASSGSLVVTTHNQRITLRPERDGTTTVVSAKPVKRSVGTRIEITLGAALPDDEKALVWARIACRLAGHGETYRGKSSPHWYDPAQFHELLSASGNRPVRGLITNLDGCSGGKAGDIVAEAGLERARCNDITCEQAALLLDAAQKIVRAVNPKRSGPWGPRHFPRMPMVTRTGSCSSALPSPMPRFPSSSKRGQRRQAERIRVWWFV
jgi:hypothetical protein